MVPSIRALLQIVAREVAILPASAYDKSGINHKKT